MAKRDSLRLKQTKEVVSLKISWSLAKKVEGGTDVCLLLLLALALLLLLLVTFFNLGT